MHLSFATQGVYVVPIRHQIFRCGNMFPSEARLLGFVVRNLIDKSYRGSLERFDVVA
jgi:hypothetical protein